MREVGRNEMDSINVVSDAEGFACLEIANWLFTSIASVPRARHVPFTPAEDPYGEMDRVRGSTLVRGYDNIVDYFTPSGTQK